MANVIQAVFQNEFAGYSARHQVPRDQQRAAQAIQRCRTAALGAHAAVCEQGHVEGVHYNSCRHRSCPQCNGALRSQWLERTLSQLLDCPHYHLIFTIPSELHPLWRCNRRLFDGLLFRCSAAALRVLTESDRYLGAQVGMLSCLHSWGRNLSVHPHVHMLVTGGGLSEQGRWRASRKGFLVPTRALMPLFRGKLLAALREALGRGRLVVPSERSPGQTRSLLNRLGRVKWNVHARSRYDHGEGVLKYLARYVRGGPLRPSQVHRRGDVLELHYQDHRHGASRLCLDVDGFISRVLTHVPCARMHTLRRYGLYARSNAGARTAMRAELDEAEPEPGLGTRRARAPKPPWARPVHTCPHCGGPLRFVRVALAARGPPGTAGLPSALAG